MSRSPLVTRWGWSAYAVAAAAVALDQASKYWIVEVFHLPARGSVALAPVFHLSMVWNRGVSFGLLRADADLARWGLTAFQAAVAIGLAIWVRRADRPLAALGPALIIGGAIGNVIDRARLGAVVDFLDFSGLYFPWVFNIADSCITVGVALILLDGLLTPRKA